MRLFSRLFAWRRIREREQEIFRFWDGSRERGVDPLVVLRDLNAHPQFKPEFHPSLILNGDPASGAVKEATEITLDAVNFAFGVEPWREADGAAKGLTVTKRLELLLTFSEYLDALKKNISGTPTSPAAMESPVLDASTTNAESDCGSISIEPKPAEPAAC